MLRSEPVGIHIKIPVQMSDIGGMMLYVDRNGVTYSESAVTNACKSAGNIPIIIHDDDGLEVVIGVANEISYKDGYIKANGIVFGGGTCESVDISDDNTVVGMKIVSIGIGV